MTRVRVALADDQALVRRGFRMILDIEPDIEVVAEAADGQASVTTTCSRHCGSAPVASCSRRRRRRTW